jgi:hypothetical protein
LLQVITDLRACEVTTLITQHPLGMTPKQGWFINKFLHALLNDLHLQIFTGPEARFMIESWQTIEVCQS